MSASEPTAASAPAIGFGEDSHAQLYELEARNFWFRARNRLILWAIERFGGASARDYLEIGCGTGYVLAAIAEHYPALALMATEGLPQGLEFARQRVPRATFAVMDARAIPDEAAFDLAGAFDVLEHIPEDRLVLGQLHRALRPGGLLVVTVPQHAFLWSPADDYARHERRYAAAELREKAESAGFEVLKLASFVSLLLPLMLISRLAARRARAAAYDPTAELRIGQRLNALLEGVLGFERWLLQRGVSFPAGGSLLLVARKPGPGAERGGRA